MKYGLAVTLIGHLAYSEWRLRNSKMYYYTVDTLTLLSNQENPRSYILQAHIVSGIDINMLIDDGYRVLTKQ